MDKKIEGEPQKKKKSGCLKSIVILGIVYFGINFVMRDSIRDMGRQAAVQDVKEECLTEGAPTGFENALWLMTKEEVKQLFPGAKPFNRRMSRIDFFKRIIQLEKLEIT